MSALYSFTKTFIAPVVRAIWRPTAVGLEHIPATGPVILASNHLSVVDSFLVPVVVSRHVYYLAKSDYYERAPIRVLMKGFNHVPVDRSGVRAALMSIDAAKPILRAGNVLGIYPEGTRSPDGRLYRGRPGVANLALHTGATIVPVGLLGTDKVQPIGARWPSIGPEVEVRVGKPLDLSAWRDSPADSRTWREITAEVMREIQLLTGQEYVGRYAPRRDPG